MKTLIRLLSILILSVTTYSCSNDDDLVGIEEPETEKVLNVYALVKESSTTSTPKLKVWKNEVSTPLTIEGDASVYGETLYVTSTDVYVGASVRRLGSKYVITIWKNGVATPITDGANDALISSIFVNGNDVYVVGTEKINGITTARIWKNGMATSLSDKNSHVNSIYIENNNIYAVGDIEIEGEDIATLWKNGSATSFKEAGIYTWFNSLYVINDKVHIAGGEYKPGNSLNPDVFSANVWVNGVKMSMKDTYFPDANAVFASEGNVYVAGKDLLPGGTGMSIAQLWKNGVGIPLTDGSNNAGANDLYVFNKDVYVGGYENNGAISVAKLWKNGESVSLSDGTVKAEVSSVIVIAQ
ncbi:hypothetical protein [uncultured Gelidibacter sp.]|uniref:hypothetical protein n=1 Tax=uncultured Gelidibacter sp. TaxID=259318 RepID=UPI002629E40C|nr:hypothetical protein [uncultured Gelidibacter sp.]